jgi:hypothetical protein
MIEGPYSSFLSLISALLVLVPVPVPLSWSRLTQVLSWSPW